jgi:hypothetical protein
MPYDPNDPRSQLGTPGSAPSRATAAAVAAPPEYFEFSKLDPDETTALGSRSWIVRSQTACLVYTEAVAGERLARTGQPDEYVAILVSTPTLPAAHVEASAADDHAEVADDAVIVVPPGGSELAVVSPGAIVRVFSNENGDLLARARNAGAHADTHPHTAPYAAWPAAPDGDRLRVYRLGDAPVEPSRFGNIYRCRTIMVNVIPVDPGARDPAKLSPHHHVDFEQLSLQLDGDYVHHIRTPWTTDLHSWRDDEHRHCTSPALTVIPPPTVHTSQGVGDHAHRLVDIFCPPRLDFSTRPGWVLNHADYPGLPAAP